jgi:uncharacterized membrane protein
MENVSRVAEQTEESRGLSCRESLILMLLVAVPVAFSWLCYDRLPQQVTSLLEPGQQLTKGRHLAMVLCLQGYLIWIYLYFLRVSARAIFFRAANRPAVREFSEQMYHLTHRLMAIAFFPGILVIGFLGPIELLRTVDWPLSLILRVVAWGLGGGSIAIFIACAVLLFRYRRVHKRASALAGVSPASDPRERDNWRFAGVYINGDNPALWIEKRWGGGWTINMGHPDARREFARMLTVLLLPLLLLLGMVYL